MTIKSIPDGDNYDLLNVGQRKSIFNRLIYDYFVSKWIAIVANSLLPKSTLLRKNYTLHQLKYAIFHIEIHL